MLTRTGTRLRRGLHRHVMTRIPAILVVMLIGIIVPGTTVVHLGGHLMRYLRGHRVLHGGVLRIVRMWAQTRARHYGGWSSTVWRTLVPRACAILELS
jgi:hypothetical protein